MFQSSFNTRLAVAYTTALSPSTPSASTAPTPLGAADHTGGEATSPYRLSPDSSHLTDTSDPIIIPPPIISHPDPSLHQHHQQYQHHQSPHMKSDAASSSNRGMLPSPPASTTYDGEDADGLPQLTTPIPGLQSVSVDPLVASSHISRSWSPSSQHQQQSQYSAYSQGAWSQPCIASPYAVQTTSPLESILAQGLELPSLSMESYHHHNRHHGQMEQQRLSGGNEASLYEDVRRQSAAFSSNHGSPEASSELVSPSDLHEEREGRYGDDEMEDQTSPGHQSDDEGASKKSGPYAELLYECLMSRTDRTMNLQQIYKWFREHTTKPEESRQNGDGRNGWQNSIRHNLSMNLGFVKVNRESMADELHGRGTKKSTDWSIADEYIHSGVQSTTRYRKANPGRSRVPRVRPQIGSTPARAASGRRGGGILHGHSRISKHSSNARQTELSRAPIRDVIGDDYSQHFRYHQNALGYYSVADQVMPFSPDNTGQDMMSNAMNSTTPALVQGGQNSQMYPYTAELEHNTVLSNYGHQQQGLASSGFSMSDVGGPFQGPSLAAADSIAGTVEPHPFARVFITNDEDGRYQWNNPYRS